MKHTFKKIAALTAITALVFTGCQQDDSPSTNQVQQSTSSKINFGRPVTFEEFQSDANAYAEFQKLKQESILKIQVQGDGYVYDTDNIVLTEYQDNDFGYKTYTFPIIPDTQTSYVQNLVIFERGSGATTSMFFNYFLTETDKSKISNGEEVNDLKDKILISNRVSNGTDPRSAFIYHLPDGRCVAYSGLEPDNPSDPNSYVVRNYGGVDHYFDVVDCPQQSLDLSFIQPGQTPGGGGPIDPSRVIIYHDPVTYDPDRGPVNPATAYPGGYGNVTHNPVVTYPIVNLPRQMYINSQTDVQKAWLNQHFVIRQELLDLAEMGLNESRIAIDILEFVVLNPSREEFARQLIEIATDDPETAQLIIDLMEDNNYSTQIMDLAEDIADQTLNDATYYFDADDTGANYTGPTQSIPNPLVLDNGTSISVTFGTTNDGVSANQQVAVDLVNAIKASIQGANANLGPFEKISSIYISATTNGEHSATSNHSKGTAVDISRINGNPMINSGASNQVKQLQIAFDNYVNIRENFGPYFKHKTLAPGQSPINWNVGGHKDHIHVSVQSN